MDGTPHPLQVPLVEQGGRPIINAGAMLSDEDLLKM